MVSRYGLCTGISLSSVHSFSFVFPHESDVQSNYRCKLINLPVQICSCSFGKEDVEDVKYPQAEMMTHLPHGNMRTFDFLFQTETGTYLKQQNSHYIGQEAYKEAQNYVMNFKSKSIPSNTVKPC